MTCQPVPPHPNQVQQRCGSSTLRELIYKRAGAPEGEPWPNEADRAREALGLATQLGPTFIKLAQALSIRTDLIPETYALELRQLQDAVPAFDSDEARAILARELLAPGAKALGLTSIFTELSVEPMAAASIGQVYKGTLLDGRQVAVKVQRPSILDEIALDLYVLRILTPLQTRLSNLINRVPQHGQTACLGSAPARPLCLLRARPAALGSSVHPE